MTSSESSPPAINDLEAADLRHLVEASLDGIVVVDSDRRIVYANPAILDMTGYATEELHGRDLLSVVPEQHRDEMIERFRRSLAGEPGRRAAAIRSASGTMLRVEYSSVSLAVDGEPHVAAIVRDITDQQRLVREAEAMLSIAATLTENRTLDERLDIVTRIAVESTRAIGCTVAVLSGEPPSLQRLRGYGLPPGFSERLIAAWDDVSNGDVAAIRAFRTQQTQIVPNVNRLIEERPLSPNYDRLFREVNWEFAIATPIVYRGVSVGALLTYFAPGAVPTDDEQRFLRAIADQAAVVIENVRLFQESRRSAILEERQRLARELHDSVSQALYGIILGTRTAQTMLERNPAGVTEPLDYVMSLAEAGMAEMRALIFELRPDALEREGLISTLRTQAEAWQARYGIEIVTDLPPEPAIAPSTKETLYRIIQEAARNAIKHANATRMDIRLEAGAEALTATVADNGQGFNTTDVFPGHFGLSSMRERAASAGGTLDLTSNPGAGTRVVARIPRRSPPVRHEDPPDS